METMMKKSILCLACFLLMVALAPCLHAQQQPASVNPADLAAQIFAPVSPAETLSPADPVPAAPPDLFMPAPELKGCTLSICLSICECTPPQRATCLNVNTCHCVCR
jgi:hypothetical protein